MSLLYFASAFSVPHFWLGRRARYVRRRQYASQARTYASSACKTCSSLHAHNIIITRFETSSANAANTPGEINFQAFPRKRCRPSLRSQQYCFVLVGGWGVGSLTLPQGLACVGDMSIRSYPTG